MEPFDCLDLTSGALSSMDRAHLALSAARSAAERAGQVRLAGDLGVLAEAVQREADALYVAWERGVLAS
jgi:hypothetical protein